MNAYVAGIANVAGIDLKVEPADLDGLLSGALCLVDVAKTIADIGAQNPSEGENLMHAQRALLSVVKAVLEEAEVITAAQSAPPAYAAVG